MDYLVPVFFAVITWWLATVLLMYRSTRAREKCRNTLIATSLLAVAGLAGLFLTRSLDSLTGAYLAFLSALAIWAWHEMTYFLGYVTGPRPESCPAGVTGWKKFGFGIRTSLYHELAIILTAALVIWINYDQPNQVGTWTFMILWLMRWSAKLNIFLGVRNLHREFWPDHLQYLGSYVRSARMNPLFPLSMLGSGLALLALLLGAYQAPADSFERTGLMLLVSLLSLAILEHVFLMIRVPDAWLWRLATGRSDTQGHQTDLSRSKGDARGSQFDGGSRHLSELDMAELRMGQQP